MRKLIIVIPFLILMFFFYPILKITIMSGKEYFLMDKDNFSLSIKTQIIDILKNIGILKEVQLFKNDSHNISSNSMSIFDPNLPVESNILRLKLPEIKKLNNDDYTFYLSKQFKVKSIKSLNKTGRVNNDRYYEVSTRKLHPKLFKIIDISNRNIISNFTNLNVECTPLFNDGKLYFPTSYNSLKCIDLFKNNKLIFELQFLQPPARRGMIIESIKNTPILYFSASKFIIAINALNGERIKTFGNNGYVKIGFSPISPEIFEDLIITSTTEPSSIIALNKRNGKLIWKTNLNLNKLVDGASPWSGLVLDRKRRAIYVTTGNPKPPLYGKDRIGKNLYSNSILSINIDNGYINWAFQETNHDLWDFDIASAPVISKINYNGKNIEVLIVPTKKGNLIVLDINDGKLIGSAFYKKSPVSDLPGEITSPYQLKITDPIPFLDNFDTNNIRDDIKDSLLSKNNLQFGLHLPPSLKKETIIYGLHGGATWPGVTIDSINNQIIFNSNRIPWKLLLYLQDHSNNKKNLENSLYKLYKIKCQNCHGVSRNGFYQNDGELLTKKIPSLIGIKYTNGINVMSNLKLFNKYHKIHISSKELNDFKNYFNELDQKLIKSKSIYLHYNWSMFYDLKGLPISKPPYGELVSYSLKNLKINWKIPNGSYNNISQTGMPSYGGIASISNNTFVTTGTPDKLVKIFNSQNGKLIWEYKMKNAGSAPPLIFSYNNKNYLAIIATGGKFYGFDNKPSLIYIFEY